jgi:dTDP-4-amino-4,6-dideoxygalactose transaminase
MVSGFLRPGSCWSPAQTKATVDKVVTPINSIPHHPPPFRLQEDFPSHDLQTRILSLPMLPNMSDQQIAQVVAVIAEFLAGAR